MIKKFNLFEKYEDIDPYGEEDWGDDGFQIGDKLRCVKDVHTISGKKIIYKKGNDYYISYVDKYSPGGKYVKIISETGSEHSFLLSNINNWFVKSTNEGKLNEGRISASLYDILGYLITKSAANIYITYQKIIHKSSDEEIAEYHDYCETLLDQMSSVTFLKNFLRNEGKPYSQSISLNKENREITDQKLSIMEELYDKIYYRDFKEDVKNVLKFYNDGYTKKVDLHTKNLLDVIKDTYNRNINEVDPYGEENWLEESVSNSEIIPEQRIIFEELLLQFVDYHLMVQWLNKNLKNKKVYFISTDDKIYKKNNTLHWFVENYEGTSRCPSVYVYMTNGECGLAKGLIYLDTEKIDFPKKFKKIENPDLDPYGEEDWGYEEIKESKKNLNFLKDVNIKYNNPEEASYILHTLHELGFKVTNLHNIENRCVGWDVVVCDGSFCFGKEDFYNQEIISFEDFLRITGKKKFKKIENPDLDPYGEEDWGYEEVKENIEYSNIEPYTKWRR